MVGDEASAAGSGATDRGGGRPPEGPRPVSRGVAIAMLCVAVAAFVAGAWLYLTHTRGTSGAAVLDLELGGTGRPAVPSSVIWWDAALIVGYGVGLGLCAWLATKVVRSPGARNWASFGLFAVVVAVLADIVEDALLLRGLAGHPEPFTSRGVYVAAAAAAVVKFGALFPAVAVGLVGLLTTATRLVRRRPGELSAVDTRPAAPVLPDDPRYGTAPVRASDSGQDGPRTRWLRAYTTPGCGHRHPGESAEATGICLSGGGIRAASVALGVLQSPEWRAHVIPEAHYLVSVSGGGYTAGAFQQALTGAASAQAGRKEEEPVRDAATAFLPGTAEEDHVRRHSSYLASTPAELLLALGLVLRHLLLTLVLLFGPAVLLGVAMGLFYRTVEVSPVAASVAAAGTGTPDFPAPPQSVWWALGILGLLAVGVWLAGQLARAHSPDVRSQKVRRGLPQTSVMLARLTGVVAMVTIGVPTLVWISSLVLQGGSSVRVGGPIAGVLLTYGASVASVAWRHRKVVTDKGTGRKSLKAAPRGPVQLILVALALTVLVAGWLLLFGGMAAVGMDLDLGDPVSLVILGALLVTVFFLGVLSDETTLSLHPFYRRRLAAAFAVRRVRRDGRTVARAYGTEERTTLSSYGRLPAGTAFPHVIFAASTMVGEKRTAPGSHSVSYTFCSHWVGGPDLGYVGTRQLEALAPPRLQRDLTVQGAVALSGAAIAASIGGQRAAWYETLFVVSGLRLGAWMPNPRFMVEAYSPDRVWHEPRLPHARRLSYLLRELIGVHASSAPLVQVTDGGFYDNLGLVELFRRGCTRIYCVDASGDDPPAATTLAETLMLAYAELGVHTELEKDTWSSFTAGGGEALSPKDPLAALNARLSQKGVITGTFEYPPGSPFAGRGKGRLVVAKSSLWSNLPYELLAHAQSVEVFPKDSTGDQFFDDRQYAGYTALGRALGAEAFQAMKGLEKSSAPNGSPPAQLMVPMPGPHSGNGTRFRFVGWLSGGSGT
jgi:hypothetical protein